MTISHPTIKKLLATYEPIWALQYMTGVSMRDMETYMPAGAVELRGKAHAHMSTMVQRFYTDSTTIALVGEILQSYDNLSDTEKGIMRIVQRNIALYTKLPESFVSEWTELTTIATEVWKKARHENNFSLFQPYLEKIIDMSLEKSALIGGYEHPYDIHLDEYEEGLKTADIVTYFDELKIGLQNLSTRINPLYKQYTGIENLVYDKASLQDVNMKMLKYFGFDEENQRLDIAVHPFCSGFTNHDVRITTRFENQFHNTLFGSIHEFGHSLYEMQYADELNCTPVAGGRSLVIHESQSRFWENIIGRSMACMQHFYDDFTKLGHGFAEYTHEHFYNHVNHIEPNLIRVDADELHYHYHVLIRFEIEKGLMEKAISVAELPAVWNQKYKEYLGIDVPNDTLGVLQDCHRAGGLFGYFPTYSMGTALSVMWKEKIEADLGSVDMLVLSSDGIAQIRHWLKDHIHQYGSTYTLSQLLAKHNMTFSSKPLLQYLEKKFC